MFTKIYSHTISYTWEDGNEERELNDIDVERIQELLKEDYITGELCQYDNEVGETHYGWWKIDSKWNY